VPMFAPIIMLMALASFIMPELTKPTTITVDAEEDWIAAVTTVPKSTPFRVVEVSLPRMVSNLLPATRFRPSPRRDMPKRKKARPPNKWMMFAIVILFNSFCIGGILAKEVSAEIKQL